MGQVAPILPEASLSRTDDRRNLLIALGAAGVTLAVALGVIGIPAVDACSADPRGVVTCLRDMADRKFDLPGTVPGSSAEQVPEAPPALSPVSAPVAAVDPQPAIPTEPRPSVPEPVPAASEPPPTASSEASIVETTAAAEADSAAPSGVPPDNQPAAFEMAVAAETSAIPETAHAPAATAYDPPMWKADLTPPPGSIPEAPEPAPASPAVVPTQIPPFAVAPLGIDLANTAPVQTQSDATPVIAAPLVLAPTIDAIELDGEQSFVSGSGPAGALMRLYADGELIGESPVEQGRWLVEGSNLLDSPRRELRIEAIEPETGKLLGTAAITVEIELPHDRTPPDEQPADPPDLGSGVAPAAGPDPVAEAVATAPTVPAEPATPSTTVAPEEVASTSEPAPLAVPEPAQLSEPPPAQPEPPPVTRDPPIEEAIVLPAPSEPEPLPELSAVNPQRESASVDILRPSELQPTTLPPIDTITHEPATITLDPPDAPALLADLVVPAPKPAGQPVTVLRLLPFGDPDSGRYNVGKAIIRRGDTLWSLAHRYYGHGIHYRTIFHANRDLIRRPSRIFPGQIFDLPLVTDD